MDNPDVENALAQTLLICVMMDTFEKNGDTLNETLTSMIVSSLFKVLQSNEPILTSAAMKLVVQMSKMVEDGKVDASCFLCFEGFVTLLVLLGETEATMAADSFLILSRIIPFAGNMSLFIESEMVQGMIDASFTTNHETLLNIAACIVKLVEGSTFQELRTLIQDDLFVLLKTLLLFDHVVISSSLVAVIYVAYNTHYMYIDGAALQGEMLKRLNPANLAHLSPSMYWETVAAVCCFIDNVSLFEPHSNMSNYVWSLLHCLKNFKGMNLEIAEEGSLHALALVFCCLNTIFRPRPSEVRYFIDLGGIQACEDVFLLMNSGNCTATAFETGLRTIQIIVDHIGSPDQFCAGLLNTVCALTAVPECSSDGFRFLATCSGHADYDTVVTSHLKTLLRAIGCLFENDSKHEREAAAIFLCTFETINRKAVLAVAETDFCAQARNRIFNSSFTMQSVPCGTNMQDIEPGFIGFRLASVNPGKEFHCKMIAAYDSLFDLDKKHPNLNLGTPGCILKWFAFFRVLCLRELPCVISGRNERELEEFCRSVVGEDLCWGEETKVCAKPLPTGTVYIKFSGNQLELLFRLPVFAPFEFFRENQSGPFDGRMAVRKEILAAHSEYFEKLFTAKWWPDDKTDLNLHEMDLCVFLCILRYMLCGMVDNCLCDFMEKDIDLVLRVMVQAGKYMFFELQCACEYMAIKMTQDSRKTREKVEQYAYFPYSLVDTVFTSLRKKKASMCIGAYE